MSTFEGSMFSNLSERYSTKEGTIHKIARNNTNGDFVDRFDRYHHQLF